MSKSSKKNSEASIERHTRAERGGGQVVLAHHPELQLETSFPLKSFLNNKQHTGWVAGPLSEQADLPDASDDGQEEQQDHWYPSDDLGQQSTSTATTPEEE